MPGPRHAAVPYFALLFSLALLMGSCTDGPRRCNGMAGLCDAPFDEVLFVRAHNSNSAEEYGYAEGVRNHGPGVTQQLEDGIRILNWDIYTWRGNVVACHGLCPAGSTPLADLLEEVRAFLASHPNEVMWIDFQLETTAAALVQSIEDAGLVEYLYTHEARQPWPTLGEMIDDGTRLVLAMPNVSGAPDWFNDEDRLVFGTPCCAELIEELDCDLQSSAFDHGLFFVSHTLTNPLPAPHLAEMVNGRAFTEARIDECVTQHGRTPNFLSIDFYRIGEVLEVVDEVNAERWGR